MNCAVAALPPRAISYTVYHVPKSSYDEAASTSGVTERLRSPMRVRSAILGLLLALTVIAFAGPATAQEEPAAETEAEIGHAEEECIHLLEEGKPVSACQEAPGRILPPVDEIIWGSLAFFILLAALLKFGRPAIGRALAARSDKIRDEVASAEQARMAAEATVEQYRQEVGGARAEAARIIADARDQAERLRDDLEARAREDAADFVARNAEQVAAERERMLGDLQSQVAALALDLAEHVVRSNLDDAAQARLIEQYIDGVAATGR